MAEIRYFESYEQDFFQTAQQDCQLPPHYRWIRTDGRFKVLSALIYGTALVFSNVYCRLFLHVRIKGAKRIRKEKDTGIFLYGNHTHPVGDVFNPALVCFPKRIYTVASPANLGIPVLGRMLPFLGALPLSNSIQGIRELNRAIGYRLAQNKAIVIYPEAHVWEYFTQIRPFSDSSFKFPAKFDKPVYCFTTTYQKRRFGKRPRATVFVDGPFAAEGNTLREKARSLRDAVFQCMVERSQESNCAHIIYCPKEI